MNAEFGKGSLARQLVRHRKRQLLQLNGQIDPDGLDLLGKIESDWRKIEDTFNAGGDEGVGDFLSGDSRDGDDWPGGSGVLWRFAARGRGQ
jgi:hypothetical protein